jgi:hypothetical protein
MLKILTKLEDDKGCTLIDLMVIFTVIGIFAEIALPHFIAYLQRAYDSQALSDARNFYKACIKATLETDIIVSYGGEIMPPGYTGLRPVKGMFAWNPKWPTIVFCNAAFKHPKGKRIYNLNAKGYIEAL